MLQGVREFAAAAKAEIKLVSRPGLFMGTVSSSLQWLPDRHQSFPAHAAVQQMKQSAVVMGTVLALHCGKTGFQQC